MVTRNCALFAFPDVLSDILLLAVGGSGQGNNDRRHLLLVYIFLYIVRTRTSV